MRFALSTEQLDFAGSISKLLEDADTPSVIRAWAAGDHGPGLAVWRRLAALGVHGLLVPEQHGGIGADAVDVAVAFEALGYHAVPGPLIETAAVLPVLLRDTDLADRMPALASGESLGTVALEQHTPYALDADVASERMCVIHGVLGEFTPSDLRRSVDPARRLYGAREVRGLGVTAAAGALNYGALACAAQLLGAGRRLLDEAVAYAKQRVQYRRPIGQYQAVKHLLADVVTELELARPLLFGAAVALASQGETADRDVSAARIACADAAYLAARTALQVHGAIGYTAEHDLGLWLTKVRALRSAWGTQAFHRGRVLDAIAC